MPFTPSHAVVAWPFARTALPPIAVGIGAMAPDLPYYLPVGIPRELTHSVAGVPLDLGLAALALGVWVVLLRPYVLDAMPDLVAARMRRPRRLRQPGRPLAPAVILVVVALLIGVATHLLWDAVTHEGPVVDAVALLRVPLGPLPLFAGASTPAPYSDWSGSHSGRSSRCAGRPRVRWNGSAAAGVAGPPGSRWRAPSPSRASPHGRPRSSPGDRRSARRWSSTSPASPSDAVSRPRWPGA